MGTAQSKLHDRMNDEATYPALMKFFTPEQCDELIRDDLRAGWSVSLVLISVLALGLLIGIVTVVATI
jgi:hypothetical protein